MPVEKELKKVIPKIYKWNVENLGLFFWVRAQLTLMPTVRIEQAINSYFKFIGISPDEWDYMGARTTYQRMQKEFFECEKNEPATTDR